MSNNPRPKFARLFALAGILLSGCAYVNMPLNDSEVPLESRAKNHTQAEMNQIAHSEGNNDGYFVGLALSGGGLRSANFSAGCMFELERLGILDRVDYISSVSGGSLTAAYYCVATDDWNPGNVQRRLTHPFATDLIVGLIQPQNILAEIFTDWDRSDILAGRFSSVLYSRNGRDLTFRDLRTDRPRLLINATDLQSGHRFVFSNDNFDELNSDLSKYPLGYAVAASAAVPVLMHHVTVRDFSTIFKRYRHLLDGGINDNLGVTSLVETYARQVKAAQTAQQADPYPKGMVLIVIDAHTNFDTELGDKPDIGLVDTLAAGAGLTSTALLNRVSSATLAELIVQYSPSKTTAENLREQIKHLEQTGTLVTQDQDGKPVQIVHLALSRVGELSEVPFASFGQRVNSIATYYNIDPNEAYHLYKAADLLIRDDRYGKPLDAIAHDLNVTAKAESK